MTTARSDAPDHPVLIADDLAVREHGRLLFSALSLQVLPGQLVSLVAPPGAARTSALLTLAGRLKTTTGRVHTDAAIGWLPGMRLFEDRATVREILLQGRAVASADLRGVDDDLQTLSLDDVADRPAAELPQLAKALVGAMAVHPQRPPVLILDLASGSPRFTAARARVITTIRDTGTAVLVGSDRALIGSDQTVQLSDPYETMPSDGGRDQQSRSIE